MLQSIHQETKSNVVLIPVFKAVLDPVHPQKGFPPPSPTLSVESDCLVSA